MQPQIRHELDDFKDETVKKAESGQCEGSCEEHTGEVVAVRVFSNSGFDWGYFSYCEAAISEDENNRGMTVERVATQPPSEV